MSTSGTINFAMPMAEIIEEAFERATTRELRTGYEFRTVLRSYNLLMIEWQNRGYNLWTVTSVDVPVVAGQLEYAFPVDAVDIVALTYVRDVRTEVRMRRMSVVDYAAVPNKTLAGVPTRFVVTRAVSGSTYTLYPVPPDSTTTMTMWYSRRIEDGGLATNDPDVPVQFMPALVAGLAYNIATKMDGTESRVQMLKAIYEELFNDAADEHRDKADTRLVPTYTGFW
jgi:hypothetical protein